jgi:hypothetical protein
MVRSNSLEYFILLFYRGSILVCLGLLVCEYESILIILTDVILLINMNYVVKYH